MEPFVFEQFCVRRDTQLKAAIETIDGNQKGIVLVVDEDNRLISTITDGDIRRALLHDACLSSALDELFHFDSKQRPITAPSGSTTAELIQIARAKVIRQIPLLDECERVVGLVSLEDLLPDSQMSLEAVIMAGGLGTRLRPLTENLPKPMLPVAGRPLLELTLEQLKRHGITRVNVTTHYLSKQIEGHFGNGEQFGVNIQYINEDTPLGTAGALSMMTPWQKPLLVVNGDILTEVDYRSMLAFHHEQEADLTIGVRKIEVQVPYGVVQSQGANVEALTEKPIYSFLVNAGIYLLAPRLHAMIPNQKHFDFTDLIQAMLAQGMRVVNFPIREYWLDIGKHDDYLQAQTYPGRQKAG